MRQKLIDKNSYGKFCENCQNGRLTPDRDRVLCKNKGIMVPTSSCRNYKYDPLKRRPKRPIKQDDFSPEDFEI